MVDNATTHTKAYSDVSMFAKSMNRACPVEYLTWIENGTQKTLDCFFRRGDLAGQSKGLFNMCKELNIIDQNLKTSQIHLEDLRKKAAEHPAFKHTSKLELLVNSFNEKYNMDIKLIFVPKFHCELNTIEMYWAFLKNHFRKNNEQSTNEQIVVNLILEARNLYEKSGVNDRLFSRFFRIINDYNDGVTYDKIMKTYYNASAEIKSHRKISFKLKSNK